MIPVFPIISHSSQDTINNSITSHSSQPIILRPMKRLSLLLLLALIWSAGSFAQDTTFTARIVDADTEETLPLVGIYISEENNTLTNFDGEFSIRYPDIRVDIQRLVPRKIMEELRCGTYDIYISCDPDLPISEEWNVSPVRSDPVGLIVRESEPVSSPEEAISLLKKSQVYLIPMEDSPATTRESLDILSLLGMEHVPKTELRPIESILFNIASGMGVAILPDHIAPLDAFGLKFVSLGLDRSMCMSMVWRRDAPPEVQAFAQLLKARI